MHSLRTRYQTNVADHAGLHMHSKYHTWWILCSSYSEPCKSTCSADWSLSYIHPVAATHAPSKIGLQVSQLSVSRYYHVSQKPQARCRIIVGHKLRKSRLHCSSQLQVALWICTNIRPALLSCQRKNFQTTFQKQSIQADYFELEEVLGHA